MPAATAAGIPSVPLRGSEGRRTIPGVTHTDRAAALLALHSGPGFVIPNAWDAGTARILEQVGFPALATTSAGIAWSCGLPDGGPLGVDTMFARVAEIVATMLFVLIILAVTAAGSTTAGFAPLAIGLALTLVHLVMIPISNSSVNPARSIATAVLGGPDALAQLWVFLVAPLVGGLIAGVIYRPLFGAPKA